MNAPAKVDREEILDFLYREAELLDEYRLEEWLKLFTDDGIYWIPLDENADPKEKPSILYDDADLRKSRVHQLLHESHWSQMPRSRTIHSTTNVRISNDDSSGNLVVRFNLVVTEFRSGGHRTLQHGLGIQRALGARCTYHLVRSGETWLIGLKKIVLINRDQAIENLTFII